MHVLLGTQAMAKFLRKEAWYGDSFSSTHGLCQGIGRLYRTAVVSTFSIYSTFAAVRTCIGWAV